jgi:tRNA C32,U32 (ribose-2'-O)-methylase TrmJ
MLVLILSGTVTANASYSNAVIANEPTTENNKGGQMMQRLQEIYKMDRSSLSKQEKNNLRKEVKQIRKDMKAENGGIYLSVAAIVIIILLLILLL